MLLLVLLFLPRMKTQSGISEGCQPGKKGCRPDEETPEKSERRTRASSKKSKSLLLFGERS